MKVTDIQAYLLSSLLAEPFREPLPGGWERTVLKHDALLIRIRTDQGLTGYAPGPASANTAQLINRNLRPAIVNMDPRKGEGVRKKVLEKRPKYPGLMQAYGAVEMALLDLRAKAEGCPLHQLLGGRTRSCLKLLPRFQQRLEGERLAQALEGMSVHRFQAMGLQGGRASEFDRNLIEGIQKLDSRLPIAFDARLWWQGADSVPDGQSAAAVLSAFAEIPILWLEEPFHPKTRESYRLARQVGRPRLAAGRSWSESADLTSISTEGLADVVQLDISRHGGYESGKRVLAPAEPVAQKAVLCSQGTALDALAALHLGVCFRPEVVEWLEWPVWIDEKKGLYLYDSPLSLQILREPLRLESGQLMIPEGPGLGMDINESVVSKYPWKSGPSVVVRRMD
ncbi:MAG: enolase C-terminal domain-like protein [Acidobacteriota bacterium]